MFKYLFKYYVNIVSIKPKRKSIASDEKLKVMARAKRDVTIPVGSTPSL